MVGWLAHSLVGTVFQGLFQSNPHCIVSRLTEENIEAPLMSSLSEKLTDTFPGSGGKKRTPNTTELTMEAAMILHLSRRETA